MKIAITGGNGFLGREVVRLLSEAGHDLRIISRRGGKSEKGVEQIKGSVEDPAALDKLLKGADVCIHLAGMVSRDPKDAIDLHRLHVQGTRLLLNKMVEHKVKRMVLASTSGTIGVNKSGATVYDDASYPLSITARWPYYLSKTYQEKLAIDFAHKNGIELLAIRPSLILGPGDVDRSSISDVENFMKKKIPSRLNGGVSFVDVRDCAAVFVNACTAEVKDGVRTYLVGSANYTLDVFFDKLARLTGTLAPALKLNSDLATTGAKLWGNAPQSVRGMFALDPVSVEMACHYWYIDSTRAKNELGFNPRSDEETLQDTIDYLRQTA